MTRAGEYNKLLKLAGLDRVGRFGRGPGSSAFARKLALYKVSSDPRRRLGVLIQAAARSKSYTSSRRILTMRAVAAAKKVMGLGHTDPSCTCGNCQTCKHRKRRHLAKQNRGGFYWDQEQEVSAFDLELTTRTARVRGR